jgi:hypothetical protein
MYPGKGHQDERGCRNGTVPLLKIQPITLKRKERNLYLKRKCTFGSGINVNPYVNLVE